MLPSGPKSGPNLIHPNAHARGESSLRPSLYGWSGDEPYSMQLLLGNDDSKEHRHFLILLLL